MQINTHFSYKNVPGEFGRIGDVGIGGLELVSLKPLLCCCISELTVKNKQTVDDIILVWKKVEYS